MVLKKSVGICFSICLCVCVLIIGQKHLVKKIDGESFSTHQLDIIAVGDSNIYSSFSPRLFYKLYHQTSYVMASPNQTIHQDYAYLKEVLQHIQPKIVLLEVNGLYSRYNKDDKRQWKSSIQMVKQMNAHEKRANYLDEYGFYESRDIIPCLIPHYMKQTSQQQTIEPQTLDSFQKIIDLCSYYQIQLVFISVPCASDWSMEKHNYVSFLAENYGLNYFDLNLIRDLQINWLFDSRDAGIHLNNNGAIKVTKMIGTILKFKSVK